MNRRALRAATMGVLLFTPVALTACSAGQTPQTVTQVRDKVGPIGQVGDMYLRGVVLAYPSGGVYNAGDDATLNMAMVNNGNQADTLVSITGPGFTAIRVGTASASSSASTTGSPTSGSTSATSTSASSTSASSTSRASTSTGSTSAGSTSASPTSASSTSSSATATTSSPSATGNQVGIRIPAHSAVFLGEPGPNGETAPTVTLVGLERQLRPGQTIPLTFTFARAGTLTLQALVAAPNSAVPETSTYNFEVPTNAGQSSGAHGGAGG